MYFFIIWTLYLNDDSNKNNDLTIKTNENIYWDSFDEFVFKTKIEVKQSNKADKDVKYLT